MIDKLSQIALNSCYVVNGDGVAAVNVRSLEFIGSGLENESFLFSQMALYERRVADSDRTVSVNVAIQKL